MPAIYVTFHSGTHGWYQIGENAAGRFYVYRQIGTAFVRCYVRPGSCGQWLEDIR